MTPEVKYPPEMLRGIRKSEWVSERPPYISAFLFDDTERKDGWREMSVTWYYDQSSLMMIKSIVRNDKSVFQGGLALIRRESVDAIASEYPGKVSYEPRPSKKNPHHGNILIRDPKRINERLIAAEIARKAIFYRIDDDIPCGNLAQTSP